MSEGRYVVRCFVVGIALSERIVECLAHLVLLVCAGTSCGAADWIMAIDERVVDVVDQTLVSHV